LEAVAKETTILASNTSSLAITDIAKDVKKKVRPISALA
jgi:3-hydroxyacyl-CoA dehydrogenase